MKTITLMHGVPGSGKSYLAKQKGGTICSADDYFMKDGEYHFDSKRLGQAHQSCKDKVLQAMKAGESIVVDNTNLTFKGCEPYIKMAVQHGYSCTIEEPQTTWKKNAEECAKRNVHNVPKEKIEMMLNKMESIYKIWEKANDLLK